MSLPSDPVSHLEERPPPPFSRQSAHVPSAQAHGYRQRGPWWPHDLPFITPEWIAAVYSYVETPYHFETTVQMNQHEASLSEKFSCLSL